MNDDVMMLRALIQDNMTGTAKTAALEIVDVYSKRITYPVNKTSHAALAPNATEPAAWIKPDPVRDAEFAAFVATRICAVCGQAFTVDEWYIRHVTFPTLSSDWRDWWADLHVAQKEGKDVCYHATCCPVCAGDAFKTETKPTIDKQAKVW